MPDEHGYMLKENFNCHKSVVISTLKSGRDTSADFRPCNRKFQDGKKSPLPCQDENILKWERQPSLEADLGIPVIMRKPVGKLKHHEMQSQNAIYHQSDVQRGWFAPVSGHDLLTLRASL